MLVLTRKIGESIQIGDDIRLTILSSQGQSVRVGIKAPQSVTVHREEVYEKIVEENRRAAQNVDPKRVQALLKLTGVMDDKKQRIETK